VLSVLLCSTIDTESMIMRWISDIWSLQVNKEDWSLLTNLKYETILRLLREETDGSQIVLKE